MTTCWICGQPMFTVPRVCDDCLFEMEVRRPRQPTGSLIAYRKRGL